MVALSIVCCFELSTAPPVDEPTVGGFPKEQQFITQILHSARSLQHESRPEQGQGFIQHILRNAEALQREQERRPPPPPFLPEDNPASCSGAVVNIVLNVNGVRQPLFETDESDTTGLPPSAEQGDTGHLLSNPNARNIRIEVG